MTAKLAGIKLAVLGGDQRELEMLRQLAATGAEIKTLGQPDIELPGLEVEHSLAAAVKGAQVVIAPMTSTDEEGYLKATFVEEPVKLDKSFFSSLETASLFLIGVARGEIATYCQKQELELIELARLDEVAILNAIPTAEGAIQIAMEESELTLHSNQALVLGLGRVGQTLARMLANLGSETYVAARKPGDRARAQEMGITPVSFKQLEEVIPEMDFIFNTVPALVLDKDILTSVSSEALIIDIASAPGGTDFQAAKKLGVKALLCLGLPGKVAPKTAGQILGEVIPRLIENRV
ncbi:dipicolinate synthase subunit DpsA [Fuchsiella alkaliacetigena]|uniref:dipicolinate synthase subunit DpsA n=1 Tax=Fuchsiella alkaliacetigena TaxID=957042 RepID=UPI00200B0DEC|nr:dipicolinate synthase subunit DpsA [Fuchsiella alkaliacetigena]MCK8823487.1 dipicolinate synthase subunit DpsA [Fuchsiella alkaliacetigena]